MRERVAASIVEAAAGVLATGGGEASMSDVAEAAGVARATVYRYFPTRQALLEALAEVAISDAAARLASARIEEVAPEEGIGRAVRALVEVGNPFVAVAREHVRPHDEEFERSVAQPIARVFERGQVTAGIRDDVPARWLAQALVGLVVSVLGARPALGREDTIAAITSIFLDGIRAPRAALP